MKKIIASLLIAVTIATATAPECNARFLTEKNTNVCAGVVSKITKTKSHGRRVYVTFSDMYDGMTYSIKLTRYEWRDWTREQGKVKRGAAVSCWLYTNNTKTLKDDEIVHIQKR